MRGLARRRTAVLRTFVVAATASIVAYSTPAPKVEATSIVPFAPAFSANDNGSIAVFGNNLMVCPASASDCAAARAGTTAKNNNIYNMVHLDVDGGAFPTFSSSSAEVVLPGGAEVRWAGLYWGARLGAGVGGVAAVGDGRQVKLRAPGDAVYRTITANRLFGPTSTSDRAYQGFADVTAIVQQSGPGVYFGADVPAATGEDRYSGWSLVVVYRAPSLPLRNLTVFDGLADVGQGDPQSITISGFRTPVTGRVNVRVGMVAYEGDLGSSGDRAVLDGTQLATSLSQGTNFFNSTNDDNGTLATRRNPADKNMLGFDIKNFDAPGILPNSATSARIDLASSSERYFPGVVTTAIDVFAPDFSPSSKTVTNLTGGTPARVGDRLRYTVTFVNGGQDPAVNTSIADPIPAGTTYVPGSLVVPDGVTGSFDPAANAVLVSPGNFPVGRSMAFSFDVDVAAAAADTEVANRATITYDGATLTELRGLTFSTRAATFPVIPSADLVITKVSTPATVVAGGVLTSTITVRNDGPSPAADVVVSDELPSAVGNVTATPSQGACVLNVGVLSCSVGTVPSGAVVTVTVQTVVPPDSTAAELADVARATSSTSDPNQNDNSAAGASDVTRAANLSIAKSASPLTVTPGGAVTYTITVTNAGPSTATSVAVTDAVTDPQVVLVDASTSAGPCPVDGSGARCTLPALAPGASIVMTVNGLVAPDVVAGAVLPDVASVSSATPDADPSDNSATAQITVGPPVTGLVITKTADAPVPLVAGLGQVRFSLDVVNNGPSDAEPVTAGDVLPPGFVVVSATSDRGSCAVSAAPSGDTVACDLGRLAAPFAGAPGARARITIAAQVPAGVPAGAYSNVATAQAPGSPAVDSNAASVDVVSLANVSVIKSFPQGAADSDITPGEPKTYRIRVVNDGPSVAEDVVATDTLPPGLTAIAWRVVSLTPPDGATPACDVASATCDLGEMAPGTAVELELDVFVDPGLVIDPAVGVANTATVTTTSTDPSADDNTSTFTVSGQAQADMSIRKFSPSPDRAIFPVPAPVAGENTSYVLEIVNFGPSAAPNPVITDVLPPSVHFVRAFEPVDPVGFTYDFCTGDGGNPETVTCVLPFTFPSFVGTNLGIEVSVDATVRDGTVLTNTASITSDAPDGNTGNNTASATVAVRAVTNVRVEKHVVEMDAGGNIVGPVPDDQVLGLPPGYAVSFVVQVTNDGPSAAADVQFIDAFPPDAANFPLGPCDFLNRETICRYNNAATGDLLLPGTSFGVQILSIPVGDTPQGVYTNTATASTSTQETTLDDNVASREVEITDPIADLVINKTAVTAPLVAGQTFTYQIAVSAGLIDLVNGVLRLSSNADNVVVSDTLPPGLVPSSATSSQGSCTVAGQDVSCALGTVDTSVNPLDPVVPELVTITGTVAADAQPNFDSDVTNTAVATSSTPLMGGVDSVSSTTTTPLIQRANLAVTKAADATSVAAGGGITFTLTVTNTGPSDATGVILTDLLPAPLAFAPAGSDPACGIPAGTVVCDIGTVKAGATRTAAIAATLPPDAAARPVTNTASVASDVDDPDGTNDTASVDVDVIQQADLAVTKTAAAEGVLLGGTIDYTLTVTNAGPSNATHAVLTDSIPAGTTAATLPTGCTDDGAGTITCDLGDVAAGDTIALDLVLVVPDTLQPGALTNAASVASATDDPDSSNNSATATVEAVARADVALTKELVTADPIAGQPLEYRLTLINNGPTIAPNASLSDPIPDGTTFVSFTATQGTCQLDEVEDVPAASCNLGSLAVGATATATLIVATSPDALTVSNTGFGGSGGLDPVPEDNEDTVTTMLQQVADLSVIKMGPASVSSAAPVQYVINYHNDGPSTVTDVSVIDTLPTGLTPRPVTGCTISLTTVSCAIAAVAAGATGSITIIADVDPAVPLGTALIDVANIGSRTEGFDDPDPTNNTSAVTSTVEALNDVGVTVTAGQSRVPAGAPVSYTVVVVNNGPQVASNVVLTNVVPPELVDATGRVEALTARPEVFVSAPLGCVATGSTITCDLGNLAVAATRTFVFTGTVAAGTPLSTSLIDTATVTFDGTDAVEANNSAADSILVVTSLAEPAPTPPTTQPAPAPAPASGSLPITGAYIAQLFAMAAALVLAGAGLRTTARKPTSRRPRQSG